MAAKKLRVLLCIPDLQDLGVQHDIRCLMKFWDRDAFEPVMLLHKREGAFADQFPPEMKSIEVDPLSFAVPRARVLTRIAGYARAFRYFDPDAVISFVPYSNLASVWARVLSRKNFGLAVSEHAHVTASLRDPESFTGLFSWYYRRNFASLYNQRADLVKCIAAESVRDLVDHHGIKPERVRLIYNPVDMEEVAKLSREPVDDPWLGDAERARTLAFVSLYSLPTNDFTAIFLNMRPEKAVFRDRVVRQAIAILKPAAYLTVRQRERIRAAPCQLEHAAA